MKRTGGGHYSAVTINPSPDDERQAAHPYDGELLWRIIHPPKYESHPIDSAAGRTTNHKPQKDGHTALTNTLEQCRWGDDSIPHNNFPDENREKLHARDSVIRRLIIGAINAEIISYCNERFIIGYYWTNVFGNTN